MPWLQSLQEQARGKLNLPQIFPNQEGTQSLVEGIIFSVPGKSPQGSLALAADPTSTTSSSKTALSSSIYLPGVTRRASGFCIFLLKGDTGWALCNPSSDLLPGSAVLWDYILAMAEPAHRAQHSSLGITATMACSCSFPEAGNCCWCPGGLQEATAPATLPGAPQQGLCGSVKPWHVVPLSTQQGQHKQPGPGWAPTQPGNKETPLQRRQLRGRGQGPCHGKRAVLQQPWEQLGSWKAPARVGD